MLVKTYGSAVEGIHATIITIEVNVAMGGTPSFFLVGLPDNAVREGRERVRTALANTDYRLPRKVITVNMAPADILKVGSAYDLPVAIGILAADGELLYDRLGDYLIMGELSLDGTVQPIRGALPMAIEARKRGYKGLILRAKST
ncbi:MAG: magnesium chelatase domain-containing protein, partial [Bacteroidota bacterium]